MFIFWQDNKFGVRYFTCNKFWINFWIKYFETPKLDKTRRKRYLRDKARSMYPNLKKVSLKTADAILIATYAKETDNNS